MPKVLSIKEVDKLLAQARADMEDGEQPLSQRLRAARLLCLLEVDYVEHQLSHGGHTLETLGDAWESLARKLCGR